jgi:hypothetical protein
VLAPPEYVIVRMLECSAKAVLKASARYSRDAPRFGELINHSDLNHWIQRLGVEAEWNKVQEKK